MTGTADESSAVRLFVIVAAAAALVFAFLTPPFKVPDEVGHFWRGSTIAYGSIVPSVGSGGASATIPVGLKTLVYLFYSQPGSIGQAHPGLTPWDLARDLPLEPVKMVPVTFPAGYTPVGYVPQIAASLIGRATGARPAMTFYLGRLLNAALFIALVAAAIRITPRLRWLFCAAGLLPMTLYLAASWSPDAMTIASSFLFTALLLRAALGTGAMRGGEIALLAAAAALVALCKPAYFLIALLVLTIPAARSRRRGAIIAAVLLVMAAGVAVSLWTASTGGGAARPDVKVDPRAQLDCIRSAPMRVAGIVYDELRLRGHEYAEQSIGRLGMLDIWLPRPVIWVEMLALLIAAACSGGAIDWRLRVVAGLVSVATIAGVALSLYIGWSAPCAGAIDGIQGRYFLPIVPLIGVAAGFPAFRDHRIPLVATGFAAVTGIVASALALAARYYS